jgi:spore coat polysaccharide biosynthesis protein SpsF
VTALIIQARMGSTRLPGKVLMDVNGKSILENLLDRLSPATGVDEIIVATTNLPEDDAIESFCANKNIKCFRGSDWDVLDRFYQAVGTVENRPDHVIRICCDNPLHHYTVLQKVLDAYIKSGADYLSNSNHEPDFLEDGFDVEVFSSDSLEQAWKSADLLSQREHVTPYIKNSGKFKCEWVRTNPTYHYKLSVDTPNDLLLAKKIFSSFENSITFGMDDVVELLEKHPEFLEINRESEINSGYQKSLREDRKIKD